MKFFTIAVISIFLLTSCPEEGFEIEVIGGDNPILGNANLGNTLVFANELVYLPDLSLKFTGNRGLVAAVNMPGEGYVNAGTGSVVGGVLNFAMNQLSAEHLLDSNDLFDVHFNEWIDADNDKAPVMEPATVSANIVSFVAMYKQPEKIPLETVNRVWFTSTATTLISEYVYYIYVDADCTITAEEVENTAAHNKYSAFTLSLKSGWNTINRKNTQTVSGSTTTTLEVKNPILRWGFYKL